MATPLDSLGPRAALVEIGRDFHARGWMSGTAGNLSARADAGHFWITASGKPKGRLDENDFLLVRAADGVVVEKCRATDNPSAETAIQATLNRLFPDAGAALHGHSVDAVLAATPAKAGGTAMRLPAVEMIKGFDLWQQNPKVDLPLFENRLDVKRIATDVENRFRKKAPPLTALLIRDHGATVWGRSLQEAYNRFECLEFILAVMARQRSRKR